MKSVFTIIITSFLFLQGYSQKLVSYEELSTLPALGINFLLPEVNVVYDVINYKVLYNTKDLDGNDHVASGLVCVPSTNGETTFPLACFQHGTVADREDVPSNEMGGHFLSVAFCGYGYVVSTPDYVGLGESPGVHPYVHSDTEASAAIDLLFATQEMIKELEGTSLNDQLFISGYSQGGHAAMALHREIEANLSDKFTVTASAPMSGPYSISEKMVEFSLGDQEYSTVAYMAWVYLSYSAAHPELFKDFPIDKFFRAEYLDDILAFANEEIDLWELNDRMTEILIQTVGTVTPRNTILPEIIDYLFNDPSHPISMALALNNTYDWAPLAPTQIYYCLGDEQITYENALLAEEVMISNGSTSVSSVRIDTDDELLDHGGCIIPASLDVIDFFSGFQNILSSVEDKSILDHIQITFDGQTARVINEDQSFNNANILIRDISGRLLYHEPLTQVLQELDIRHMNSGFYVLSIEKDNKIYNTTKLIRY